MHSLGIAPPASGQVGSLPVQLVTYSLLLPVLVPQSEPLLHGSRVSLWTLPLERLWRVVAHLRVAHGLPLRWLDTVLPIPLPPVDELVMARVGVLVITHETVHRGDWGDSTRKRIQQTTLTLRGYGGDRLAIVGQVSCKLSRGRCLVEAELQVQERAPVELLLGTDTLAKLGFTFRHAEGERCPTNLLPEAAELAAENTLPIVKLLHATHLPARHSRLVRAEVPVGEKESGAHIIEPERDVLRQKGLTMADTVVGVDEGGEVALVIANHRERERA